MNHVQPLDGVKIGRIHSLPRGVTRRRCGFLPTYFGHLLMYVGETARQSVSLAACQSNMGLASRQQHLTKRNKSEFGGKRYLDRFKRVSAAHPCVKQTQTHRPRYVRHL